MIDPELKTMIDAMVASGFALPEPFDAPSLRAIMDPRQLSDEHATVDMNASIEPIAMAEVRELRFVGPAGDVPARLYHPHPGKVLPFTVMLHGGGWVVGTLDSHDTLARTLARESGYPVLSIAYRLAPEHPFPAPLEDCMAVIAALQDRAEELAIDAARWAITGDRAGGNLAAAAALKLRGQRGCPVAQLLFYPVTDNDFTRDSYSIGIGTETLSADLMRFFWRSYIGDAEPSPYAALLRAKDLSGLAPATIILGGYDVLHDEGLAYAERLREAGVPVNLHDYSGAVHGFASFIGMASIADEAVKLGASALKRALSGSTSGAAPEAAEISISQ